MMNNIIRFRYFLSSYQMFTACCYQKKIYSLEFISKETDEKNIIHILLLDSYRQLPRAFLIFQTMYTENKIK